VFGPLMHAIKWLQAESVMITVALKHTGTKW